MPTHAANDAARPIGTEPRALAWLRTAFVASLVGPFLLLAYVGWTSHAEAIAAARSRLARVAQIVQEQSQRIVETNEVISRGIVARIGTSSTAELMQRRVELHSVMKIWTDRLRQLQSVWIWDETGHPIATNLRPDPPASLDVSDREYFVWARGTTATGWYVSAPLRSRTTGQLFFDLSKRRSAADGSFQGVVSVSLLPAYFDAFFREQVVNEPGFALSLVRADGTLLSRYPPPPPGAPDRLGPASPLRRAMAANSPAGEVRGVSSVDGEYRYVAYRRVDDLPLYAVATANEETLLAPWWKSFAVLAAFTVPLALGLAALCWFAMRRVRSEHAIALAHHEQYEQRVKAEDALRQAQKMEALGRLTGGVAHDFNNLLMVVQTSVAVARQLEARGQPLARALAPIERAVSNGAQLTRQLLAVVRRQPLQVSTVDLREVIPALAHLMASTLGSNVRIDQQLEGTDLWVTIDQAELELALINLCINAKDAMPEGGRIEIAVRGTAPPADAPPSPPWVVMTVSDSGEGIPPEVLARVTEPFFTTKPLGKGTGLGLSQVQSFVAQAHGRLEIASEPGRGTQVRVLLPASVVVPKSEEAAQVAPARLEAAVLLVEDNPDIGQSVSTILEQAGAVVTWHTSADAAWHALSRDLRVDAVLSDVSLPGDSSGIDLARRLAHATPPIPIVLMTGYTDRLQEAVAAGFLVVPKPAAPETLLAALRVALARSQSASGVPAPGG